MVRETLDDDDELDVEESDSEPDEDESDSLSDELGVSGPSVVREESVKIQQ